MKYLLSLLCLTLALSVCAQESTKEKNPTEIRSSKFIFEGMANRAELIDSVMVDDDDVVINCDKMIIYLKSDTEMRNAQTTDTGLQKSNELSGAFAFGGDGKVDRIECIGNVLIIRKNVDPMGNPVNNQRCTAGKAIYYVGTEKIELMDKPIIYDAKNKVTGTLITIYRNDSRIEGDEIKIIYYQNKDNTPTPRETLRPGGM